MNEQTPSTTSTVATVRPLEYVAEFRNTRAVRRRKIVDRSFTNRYHNYRSYVKHATSPHHIKVNVHGRRYWAKYNPDAAKNAPLEDRFILTPVASKRR